MFTPVNSWKPSNCFICMQLANTQLARPNICGHLFHYDCLYRWAETPHSVRAYVIETPGTISRPDSGTPQVNFLPGPFCPVCRLQFYEIIRIQDVFTKSQKQYMSTPRPCLIKPEFKAVLGVNDSRYVEQMRNFEVGQTLSSLIDDVVKDVDGFITPIHDDLNEETPVVDLQDTPVRVYRDNDDFSPALSMDAPDSDFVLSDDDGNVLDSEELRNCEIGKKELKSLNLDNSYMQAIDRPLLDELGEQPLDFDFDPYFSMFNDPSNYLTVPIIDNGIMSETVTSNGNSVSVSNDTPINEVGEESVLPTTEIAESAVSSFVLPNSSVNERASNMTRAPLSLYCPICDKTFNSTGAKGMHQQKHKGVKIECVICKKSFSTRSNLATHKKKYHSN